MPQQYSIGMVPICGKAPDKCRRLATERGDLIHASHLEREKGPALVALDVKLDRPTADFAVFDVRRLVRGQIDERLEALAAIRAPHRHEDRKSTRLNSSHGYISYAVFCLKK